jgi:predicted PurR-regulated permease PerM
MDLIKPTQQKTPAKAMAHDTMRSENLFIPLLFLLFAILLGWLFSPYLKFILVALLLAVATGSINREISSGLANRSIMGRWEGTRNFIAATVSTLFFVLFLFAPLAYFLAISSSFIMTLDPAKISRYLLTVEEFFESDSVLSRYTEPVVKSIQETFDIKNLDVGMIKTMIIKTGGILKKTGAIIAQIGWILLFYFLMVFYWDKLQRFFFELLPLSKDQRAQVASEFVGTLSVVFYGTLASMFLQGIAFGVLMALIGGYDYVYLGIMAGFFSVIPVVGASIIYLPVAAIEMIDGNMATGLLIIAYAMVIMGFLIDNVIRLALIGVLKRALGFSHSIGEIPIMLSMIAGISTLGFWGVIIGPSILSVASASAQLYIDSRRNND